MWKRFLPRATGARKRRGTFFENRGAKSLGGRKRIYKHQKNKVGKVLWKTDWKEKKLNKYQKGLLTCLLNTDL